MSVAIRQAWAADLASVEGLLQAAGLTAAGVAEHIAEFQVAEAGGQIVGTAGLELYGRAALLRSVAVDPAYRGRAVGRALVARVLDRARAQGVDVVFLLTTTAAGYFRRFGFIPVARDVVPAEVQASPEFGDECCATAETMVLRVTAVV